MVSAGCHSIMRNHSTELYFTKPASTWQGEGHGFSVPAVLCSRTVTRASGPGGVARTLFRLAQARLSSPPAAPKVSRQPLISATRPSLSGTMTDDGGKTQLCQIYLPTSQKISTEIYHQICECIKPHRSSVVPIK